MEDPLITFSIIEDNKIYRTSLIETLTLVEDIEHLSTFGNAEAGLKAFKANAAAHPGILLLDINLPGQSGITLLPEIHAALPNTDIIVLTQNDDHRTALNAISLGATGYLVKGESIVAIRNAMREVRKGATVIDASLSRLVINALALPDTPDMENPLTPQEQKVLSLLAQGFAKKEVAAKINLSLHAIDFHTRNIYKKLRAPNIAAAIATAIRQKLI
ncbi:MAG: DNA-binding response regulator [Verrucomicrobia bacterium]|nr:MAG: DNA-binding response regulator [Verrucomicrobiota bacterium]